MNLIYRFLSVHLFGRPFPKPWCSSDGVVFINILSFLVLVSILLVALIKGIVLPVYLVVLATLFALVISYPAALFSAREWPTKANFLGHYSFLTVLKIVGAVIFILLVISHRSDLFVLWVVMGFFFISTSTFVLSNNWLHAHGYWLKNGHKLNSLPIGVRLEVKQLYYLSQLFNSFWGNPLHEILWTPLLLITGFVLGAVVSTGASVALSLNIILSLSFFAGLCYVLLTTWVLACRKDILDELLKIVPEEYIARLVGK